MSLCLLSIKSGEQESFNQSLSTYRCMSIPRYVHAHRDYVVLHSGCVSPSFLRVSLDVLSFLLLFFSSLHLIDFVVVLFVLLSLHTHVILYGSIDAILVGSSVHTSLCSFTHCLDLYFSLFLWIHFHSISLLWGDFIYLLFLLSITPERAPTACLLGLSIIRFSSF